MLRKRFENKKETKITYKHMKTYKHLYEKFISKENIRLCINKAAKGKRKSKEVQKVLSNVDYYITYIQNHIIDIVSTKHTPVEIYDGIQRKKRTIVVPTYFECIVHHMLVQVLMPLFSTGMYEHSYGSVPNKGTIKGMKTVKRWIADDYYSTQFCLQCDIRKYFQSIPHSILKRKFIKRVKDRKILNILFIIIDSIDEGIALGFYIFQWIANWYLEDFDHYIKEVLKAKYYIRNMDDIVIFASSKKELHEIRKYIQIYLQNVLQLQLKNTYAVFKIQSNKHHRTLDFLGFKFYRNRTILRKTILRKMRRKALKIFKKNNASIYDSRQMLSYLSYIKYCDIYNYYIKWIKGIIDFRTLRHKMSKYDKERNEQYDRLCICG